jgi:integrase
MAGWQRTRRWLGGYVRRKAGGPEVWVVERMVAGRRIHRALDARSEREALTTLARLEAGLVERTPEGQPVVVLDSNLRDEYRAHQLAAGVTPDWATEMKRGLDWWMSVLPTLTLQHLQLRDLRAALGELTTRRPQRIKAIKGLCTWLREEGRLKASEDPAADLRVPRATPAKLRRRKVVDLEVLRRTFACLRQPYRDILTVQLASAWHISEVRRWALSGELLPAPAPKGTGAPELLGVLVTWQAKSGEPTRTPVVHPEHLEAARRLRALVRGPEAERWFPGPTAVSKALRQACDAANRQALVELGPTTDGSRRVPRWSLGQMRHTVLTAARQGGAAIHEIAAFAHHRSQRTTTAFYLDLLEPVERVPLLRLVPDAGAGGAGAKAS